MRTPPTYLGLGRCAGAQGGTTGTAPVRWSAAFVEGPAGRATVALIVLRIMYAYNWLDIGPALGAIQVSFGVGPASWGLLLAAFLVGAGLLQVPAGLLSLRYGSRSVSIWGVALLGIASVATGFVPNFASLVVLRGVAGAGAGLFFSPAIGLVASLHPEGRRGIAVGTFSSAFSAGAALGVFLTAVLVPVVGWRAALAMGGAALLALLLWATRQIPASEGAPTPSVRARGNRLPSALSMLAIWSIGFAFVGLEGAAFSTGQYYVPYAEQVRGYSNAVAGAVSALFVFPSVFGGPIGGLLAERSTLRRTQLVGATAVGGILVALVPFVGLWATAAIAAVFSFVYGIVYAVMYVLPRYLPRLPADEVPLGIGVFNAIQLAGGAAVTFLFGWVVAASSYSIAWVVLGVLTFVPLVFLAGVPPSGAAGSSELAVDPRAAGSPPSSEVGGPP